MQSETADFVPGASSWRTKLNIRVVFDFGLFAPLCENMTLSTKPEVHNVLHCRQRRIEPRLRVTLTDNLVKFKRGPGDYGLLWCGGGGVCACVCSSVCLDRNVRIE